MRTLAPILAVVAAAGCATARPAAQAHAGEVVQLQPDRVKRCRYLGAVQGIHANGTSVAQNDGFAIEEVRGQVARMGGTAFAITGRDSNMWRSVVHANAYLCPSWEPVPGLAPSERPPAR